MTTLPPVGGSHRRRGLPTRRDRDGFITTEGETVAHFRGTVQGNRGEGSRCGSKSSGLDVRAASWSGAVSVRLWHDDDTGTDMAEVRLERHHGAGTRETLYRGPVEGSPVPA